MKCKNALFLILFFLLSCGIPVKFKIPNSEQRVVSDTTHRIIIEPPVFMACKIKYPINEDLQKECSTEMFADYLESLKHE